MTRTDEIEELGARIDAALEMVVRRIERATDQIGDLINGAPSPETSAEVNRIDLNVNEEPVNPLRHWRWE
jgi:hypothetical protein